MKEQVVKTYENIQTTGKFSAKGQIDEMDERGYKVVTMCMVYNQLVVVYESKKDRNYPA